MQTKGWDTISVIKQDSINEEIRRNWANLNPEFNYILPDGAGGITGRFNPWQVINGGGGKLLRMELPIAEGVMLVDGKPFEISGISAIIELTLTMMPQPDKTILKTQYSRIARDVNEIQGDNEGWIHPITLVGDDGRLGVFSELLLDSICEFLIEHPDRLVLTFAEISLNKAGCPEWLLPKTVAYSYLDTGYLSVLAVCDDRGRGNLPLDVDVSGLTDQSDSFFIISPHLLFKNLIVPSLCSIYQNASVNDFSISDDGFHNTRDLDMEKVKSGAIYYTPVVYAGKNEGSIDGSSLTISYDGYCNMYAGIDMYWDGFIKMKVSLGSDGTISFNKYEDNFDHHEHIPWYLEFLCLLVGAITAIVVAIISDDLIDKIAEQSASFKADNINCVEWFGEQRSVKNAYLSEALVLQYN